MPFYAKWLAVSHKPTLGLAYRVRSNDDVRWEMLSDTP